jgi:hypothetical protein
VQSLRVGPQANIVAADVDVAPDVVVDASADVAAGRAVDELPHAASPRTIAATRGAEAMRAARAFTTPLSA